MNAQIGKYVHNKFSLQISSNWHGVHPFDFVLENKLTCLNTTFQKRKGKLWICTYANNFQAQICYTLINKKRNNSALNCETYSTFEGESSNHRIVTAKIRVSLRRNAALVTAIVHYDWSLLNNRDIRDKYILTLKNIFDAVLEISETPSLNDEHENFVNVHL